MIVPTEDLLEVDGGINWQRIRDAVKKSLWLTMTYLPFSDLSKLPHDSGLYLVTQRPFCNGELEDEAILYIGKSVDLSQRWKGHKFRDHVRAHRASLYYRAGECCAEFRSLEDEETVLIGILGPRENMKHNGRLYPQKSKQIFGIKEEDPPEYKPKGGIHCGAPEFNPHADVMTAAQLMALDEEDFVLLDELAYSRHKALGEKCLPFFVCEMQ